jgi:23S rRNA pseudouridine1911/1915/1917 synthase
MGRQALHAWHLAFAHPITGQVIDLTSKLPQDMQNAVDVLGLSYNTPPG